MTDKDYSVKLVSTDEGTMDCTIKEFLDGEEKRTLSFYNVPLAVGIEYEEEIPNPINIPTVDYALKSNNQIQEKIYYLIEIVFHHLAKILLTSQMYLIPLASQVHLMYQVHQINRLIQIHLMNLT